MATIQLQPPLDVQIEETALKKLLAWTRASDIEFSVFGEAIVQDGRILLTDTLVLPAQICSVGHTTVGAQELMAMMETYTDAGKSTKRLVCWYHSHGILSGFYSATDYQNIKEMRQWMPLVVAGVFSKVDPPRWLISQSNVGLLEWTPPIVLPPTSEEELSLAKRELAEKVTEEHVMLWPWTDSPKWWKRGKTKQSKEQQYPSTWETRYGRW